MIHQKTNVFLIFLRSYIKFLLDIVTHLKESQLFTPFFFLTRGSSLHSYYPVINSVKIFCFCERISKKIYTDMLQKAIRLLKLFSLFYKVSFAYRQCSLNLYFLAIFSHKYRFSCKVIGILIIKLCLCKLSIALDVIQSLKFPTSINLNFQPR